MNEIAVLIVAIVAAVIGYRFAARKQQARSLDGYTIKKLEESGLDISSMQLLEFWFYASKKLAIENLASELEKQSFEVHIADTEQEPRFVVRAKKSMIPDLVHMQSLRKEFNDLASRVGAVYDGWGVIVN